MKKYSQKSTKNKLLNPKALLVIVAVILLAAGGAFAYRHFSSKPSVKPTETTQQAEQKINYNPPTDQDKQSVDQHKEDISKNDQTSTNSSQTTTQKSANVVIVDASQYDQQIEVRAYISGVIENGGTCTYAFSNGSAKVTKQTSAVADATTTRCPTLDVARSEFSTGNWSVTVSYSSSAAQGTSSAKSFEVK